MTIPKVYGFIIKVFLKTKVTVVKSKFIFNTYNLHSFISVSGGYFPYLH